MSYAHQSTKAIKVFYSYSRKDEDLRDEMENCLKTLKRQGIIEDWHDRKIGAGSEWAGEINERLNTADIILLLVSPDFLASDYCYDVEVKRAMERHEAGQARVIPVLLRVSDWQHAPFSKLQALPKNAKPVKKWEDRDEAFQEIAEGIRKAVEEMTVGSAREKNTSAHSSRHVKPPISDKYRYLLPYLCDRSEQVTDLETAIREQGLNRPFICIAHGDEQECHDMFRLRLLRKSLHRILKLKKDQALREDYSMAWPSSYKSSPDPIDSFRSNLARMLECDSQASQKEMARRLAVEKDPVIIHTDPLTRDWKPHGRELMESFINCWSKWPELNGQVLIVYLSFKYEQGRQRDFLSRRRWAKHNKEVRDFFDQLQFQKHYNLPGTVLPELCPIRQTDAAHWVHTHARSVYGDEVNIDDCSRKIRSIYASRDVIAMEELADYFKEMIGKP